MIMPCLWYTGVQKCFLQHHHRSKSSHSILALDVAPVLAQSHAADAALLHGHLTEVVVGAAGRLGPPPLLAIRDLAEDEAQEGDRRGDDGHGRLGAGPDQQIGRVD